VNLIADVLDHPGNDDVTQSAKQKVSTMMKSFPVYKK